MTKLKDTEAFKEFMLTIAHLPENEQAHRVKEWEKVAEQQEKLLPYYEKIFAIQDKPMLNNRQAKLMFVDKAKAYDSNFDPKLNAEYYNVLIYYLYKETERGLYVYGNVGSGKTLGMYAATQVKPVPNQINARLVTENTILADFESDKEMFRKYRHHNLVIDDFGTNTRDWKVDIIRGLIEDRYLLFKKDKKRTFFTSNLKPDDIERMYGLRVADRVKEMCEFILVKQESLRK